MSDLGKNQRVYVKDRNGVEMIGNYRGPADHGYLVYIPSLRKTIVVYRYTTVSEKKKEYIWDILKQ